MADFKANRETPSEFNENIAEIENVTKLRITITTTFIIQVSITNTTLEVFLLLLDTVLKVLLDLNLF